MTAPVSNAPGVDPRPGTAPRSAGSGPARRALRALDDYTSPRENTSGNLEEHDYLQSLFHAWGSGYSFMGLPGVGIASACSVASTFVARRFPAAVAVSAGVAVAGTLLGLAASVLLDLPPGATIVLVLSLLFGAAMAAGRLRAGAAAVGRAGPLAAHADGPPSTR